MLKNQRPISLTPQAMFTWNKNNSNYKYFLKIIRSEFPDLIIDAVLETGSHAKGEAHLMSDNDFRVYGRVNSRLLVNPTDTNNDISEVNQTKVDLDLVDIYNLSPLTIRENYFSALQDLWKTKFNILL